MDDLVGRRAAFLGSTALAVAMLAASGMFAASVHAAPVLDLTVVHSPTTMPKSDQLVKYSATIKNMGSAVTNPAVGDQLSCVPANWAPGAVSGAAPTFSYEWRRNGVAIAGANSSAYMLVAADAGAAIQCVVTGTNAFASTSAASQPPAVIAPVPSPLPPAPSERVGAAARPTIAGTGTATRTCSPPANWTGLSASDYTYQWLRNGQPISGATSNTYAPDAGTGGADLGKVLQCQVLGTNAGGSTVGISVNSNVGTVTRPPNQFVSQAPSMIVNATTGAVTLTFDLPAGGESTRAYAVTKPEITSFQVGTAPPPDGWSCDAQEPSGLQGGKVTCTRADPLAPGAEYPGVTLWMALDPSAIPDPMFMTASISGGGAGPVSVQDVFGFLPALEFGLEEGSVVARAVDQSDQDYTQAGGHPFSASVSFDVNKTLNQLATVAGIGFLRSVVTDLPSGFIGNPQAVPQVCDTVELVLASTFTAPTCPQSSIVGAANLRLGGEAGGVPSPYDGIPIYAIKPERGKLAQFVIALRAVGATYSLFPRLRPEDGYAITVDSPSAPKGPSLVGATVMLCGYGVDLALGAVKLGIDSPKVTSCKAPTDPGANSKPFLTNPTECLTTPPFTRLSVDSWDNPGVFDSATFESPLITGCDQVPFTPAVSIAPTSSTADSASGVDADISVPSDGLEDPDGVSQSHLRKAVVTLPEGVSVNPSAASGLEACSDAQLKPGTNDPVECPDGSKIGSVDVETPLLEEHLTGDVVLRTPKSTEPESGDMLRLAIVARSEERGLLVKLPGSATADAETGRLVATFDNNPQVPFSNLKVRFKGGSRGVLGMPQRCSTEPDQYESVSTFHPWSQAHLPEGDKTPTVIEQNWTVDGDCSYDFNPGLKAGMSNAGAREGGSFGFEFTRPQGDQTLKGLTAELPTGLLATVKDLPLCTNAQADAGNCPAASRIGLVDASAGSGDPFVLEKKGEIFLTEGYKGGAYGLMVKVRPIAGPFRGAMELSPIIVRQKIEVDPETAQVKVISDPFPLIHHGIPLRVRRVLVKIDRDNFMVNPSDCSAKQVKASLTSSEGTRADLANHFQVRGCAALPFGPKIRMRNLDKGRRSTLRSWNPRMKFVVRQQGVGEAGISGARVTLPSSVILDQSNLDTVCTRVQMAAKDCPAGSIVGYARAFSPLLNRPVQGPVYLAANGGVRPLPDVVAVLDGEIKVVLESWIDTVRRGQTGRLRSIFSAVPDAPISRFVLTMRGGKNRGLLVNSTDLCRTNQRAVANFSGHNGKRSSSRPRIGLRFKGCKKARRKIARRVAKRKIARKKTRQARAARVRATSKD